MIPLQDTSRVFPQDAVFVAGLDTRVGAKGRVVAPGYALKLGPEFLDYVIFDYEVLPVPTP